MTSINPIATKVAAGSAPNASAPLQGSTSGVLGGVGGQNFFDLILSNLLGGDAAKTDVNAKSIADKIMQGMTNEQAAPATTPANVSTATGAVKSNENSLALLQIALANQGVDADGNIVLQDASLKADTLQSSLTVTDKVINHLKNMLPENADKEGVFSQLISKLQAKSDTLRASLSALNEGMISKDTAVEDIPMPLLISLGLNPSEIAEVATKIEDLEKKLGRDITVEDLIAGVGGIIPPAPETAVVASASIQKTITTDLTAGIGEDAEPTDDLARQLNALDVGGSDDKEKQPALNTMAKEPMLPAKSSEQAPARNDLRTDADIEIPADDAASADKAAKDTTAPSAKDAAPTNTPAQAHTAKTAASASNGFNNLTFQSALSASAGDAASQGIFFGTAPATSYGAAAQAANVITSSATAGQPHPAANIVAATMIKSAKAGDDQTIRLRLDPPELGNVGIRLQFSKDKTVKAHIVAEKAETYMMLQKDS
ncbi:MAG: hypothetical protein DI626_06885, partial [Micavibrio aeruginosavorus]